MMDSDLVVTCSLSSSSSSAHPSVKWSHEFQIISRLSSRLIPSAVHHLPPSSLPLSEISSVSITGPSTLFFLFPYSPTQTRKSTPFTFIFSFFWPPDPQLNLIAPFPPQELLLFTQNFEQKTTLVCFYSNYPEKKHPTTPNLS